MTTELSSAKYFSTTYANPSSPAAQAGDESGGQVSGAYYAPRPVTKAPTATINLIVGFLALAGIFGVMGGVFGAIGQANIDGMTATQAAATIKSKGYQNEIYRRTLENRKKLSLVSYMHSGICVLVGFGFLASCFLLMTNSTGANSFTSTACIIAIFYNLMTLVVTWLMLPSFEGVRGLPDGAGNMALFIAVGFAAVITLFKLGIYGTIIAVMSSKSVKAVYEPQAQTATA